MKGSNSLEQEKFSDVHDKDEMPEKEQAVNILRERTFNDELRRLVDVVTGREADGKNQHIDESGDDIDKISANELLLRFHRLFYRTKNLSSLDGADTRFDPFPGKVLTDKINEAIKILVVKIMEDIAPSGFSLFSYDLKQKGYTVFSSTVEELSAHTTVIGLHDAVFQMIMDHRQGCFVEINDLSDESTFKRLLERVSERKTFEKIYCINLLFITEQLHNEFSSETPDQLSSYLPYPILIILCDRDKPLDESHYYGAIMEKLSFPLSILEENEINDFSFKSSDTMKVLFDKMEYFCQRMRNSGFDRIYIVKLQNSSIDTIFILEYIFGAMKQKFPDTVFPVRLNPEGFGLFCKKSADNQIRQALEGFVSITDNSISIEGIDYKDSSEFHHILYTLFA